IASYGDGPKPLLNGQGKVDHVIRLENTSYWEIYDLEITNPAEQSGDRVGVLIRADQGMHRHFHLKNLYSWLSLF
ncbi:MAG: right-handed parallel beta-helix repeat-containing protein, partial [Saprospiraceae bacterium]|nr:right-handed parallel beta-helix repeat-containing protein [Saprospiraceae bacterium]